MDERCSVWIGFDPKEAAAFAVCRSSIRYHTANPSPSVRGIILNELRRKGLYTRPTERRNGQLWDVISDAPMSTEFAVSRFLTPHLAKAAAKGGKAGWALFMDCDILARTSLWNLFRLRQNKYAVMVVKHVHDPDYQVKMEGQAQTKYARKNWSSVMLFNVDHPANAALTLETVNALPGRDLHRFCWLDDGEIGELDPTWNYLVGHTQINEQPKLVHFTDGPPTMRGYEHVDYADEFWAEMDRWAA
jgi:hypothetical protein